MTLLDFKIIKSIDSDTHLSYCSFKIQNLSIIDSNKDKNLDHFNFLAIIGKSSLFSNSDGIKTILHYSEIKRLFLLEQTKNFNSKTSILNTRKEYSNICENKSLLLIEFEKLEFLYNFKISFSHYNGILRNREDLCPMALLEIHSLSIKLDSSIDPLEQESLYRLLHHETINISINSFDLEKKINKNESIISDDQISNKVTNFSDVPDRIVQLPRDRNAILLPFCEICIRRLRLSNKVLIRNNEFSIDRKHLVCPLLNQNSETSTNCKNISCMACFIYYFYHTLYEPQKNDIIMKSISIQSKSPDLYTSTPLQNQSKSLWSVQCLDCGLAENIWCCLICGYTGCGRYTSQHAHLHFLSTGHTFSMELASGRIWDYFCDNFVHYDTFRSLEGDVESESSHNFGHEKVEEDYSKVKSNFSTVPRCLIPMNLEYNQPHPNHNHFTDSSGLNSSGALFSVDDQLLESSTMQKLKVLIDYYERLFDSQLHEQELYFEKLLARETINALELYYNVAISESSDLPNKQDDKTEEVFKSSTDTRKSTNDEGMRRLSRLQENDSLENIDVVSGEDSDLALHLEEIEALKVDISCLEAEYLSYLNAVSEVESEVKEYKKVNDQLIKAQKKQRQTEQSILDNEKQLKTDMTKQALDLEQQIQDLEFYLRTKTQFEKSPLRDEIQGGSIITTSRPYSPTPPRNKQVKGKKKKN